MRKLAAVGGALAMLVSLQAQAVLYTPVSLENKNSNAINFTALDGWSADTVDITGNAFSITNPTFFVDVPCDPITMDPCGVPGFSIVSFTVTADSWDFNLANTMSYVNPIVTGTNHVCDSGNPNPNVFFPTCTGNGFSDMGDGWYGVVTGSIGDPVIQIEFCNFITDSDGLDAGCFLDPAVAGVGSPEGSTYRLTLNLIPIPAAVWLFGSALGLLAWARRRMTAA